MTSKLQEINFENVPIANNNKPTNIVFFIVAHADKQMVIMQIKFKCKGRCEFRIKLTVSLFL